MSPFDQLQNLQFRQPERKVHELHQNQGATKGRIVPEEAESSAQEQEVYSLHSFCRIVDISGPSLVTRFRPPASSF